MIHLILIGAGKWGRVYIKTLSQFSDVKLTIANRDNWRSLIDSGCDGVLICTPPESHIEIAAYSLSKGYPTMIEKPVSLSVSELVEIENYQVPILINHIHLFSESYQIMKESVGTITSIESLGFNNGPHRPYSALWDYGPHDLSMILDLVGHYPSSITTTSLKTVTGELFNIKMNFGHIITESLVGNGGMKKVRKLKVNFDGLSLIYDDKNRPSHHDLPLTNALKVFINAIKGKTDSRLGLELAKQVTKVLEECQKVCNNHTY